MTKPDHEIVVMGITASKNPVTENDTRTTELITVSVDMCMVEKFAEESCVFTIYILPYC